MNPIRISIAYGKPLGRGSWGMKYTWAAWWRSEPSENPWTPPDSFGGGATAEDARARAEASARRFKDGRGPVVELPAKWARAERTRRKNEREAASLQRARERAERNLEEDTRRIREFIQGYREGGMPEDYLLTPPCDMGIPGVYVIDRRDSQKVYAHHLVGGRSCDIELDRAELERAGRVWSDQTHSYVFAVPPDLRRPRPPEPRFASVVDIIGAMALEALGLKSGATTADVQRAYRRRVVAEKAHPDQGGAAHRFIELTQLRDRALSAAVPLAPRQEAAQ